MGETTYIKVNQAVNTMTIDDDLPGQRRSALLLKRVTDMMVVGMLSIVLSPVLFFLAIVIRLDSKGWPFYNQDRVGHQGKRFRMFKFRTMYQDCSGIVLGKEVLPEDERVTRIGRYLRRFKVDELPQFLNVLLGHVSLVGPRPDIPVQAEAYTDYQRQRLSVPQGLTGIAQVSGNIWMSWEERIALDVWYIQNWSLWLDLRIIWHTFRVLLFGEQPDADPFGLKAEILGKVALNPDKLEPK